MDDIAKQISEQIRILDLSEHGDDLKSHLQDLCDQLERSESKTAAFPAFFELFERYPREDFGKPGPLVHTLESTFPGGYESLLLDSINRAPSPYTLWMANRIINGLSTTEEKAPYLEALKVAADRIDIPEEVRSIAAEFLELHSDEFQA